MEANEAVLVERPCTADALRLVATKLPPPRPSEAQIRIEAAGVAYADIALRRGVYPGAALPAVLGYDLVGRVEALGSDGFSELRVGDRVVAVTVTGGYARRANVETRLLARAPEGVEAAKLAAIALNGLTAWQMVRRLAPPAAGEFMLVHGAAGGAGALLLDIGRDAGAQMIGTVSAGKRGVVTARGAAAIDYRAEDFVARARALSGGGVVAAFDHVGGAHLKRSLRALRAGGVAVSYGFYNATRGGRVRPLSYLGTRLSSGVDAFALFKAGASLATYNIQSWRDARPLAYAEDLAAVIAAVAAGRIDPEIADTLPLERAGEAHRKLESAAIAGKLVLLC